MLDDPKRFEGLDLADPIEGLDGENPDHRIARIMIGKDRGVPFIYSFLHGGGTYRLRYGEVEEIEEIGDTGDSNPGQQPGFVPLDVWRQQHSEPAQLALILRIAQKLWGASTSSLYRDYSFGNKVVNIRTGAWFDFDANEGGTLRDLMKKATTTSRAVELPAPKLHWYGDADPNADIEWTIQDLIPKIGKGLISGQFGTYKTFAALALAGSAMTGEPFINFEVRRRGGVLYVAPEGCFTIP